MVKKILSIVLWVITGAALVTLFVFGRKWYLDTPLQGVVLQLDRHDTRGFVEKDTIIAYAEAICGIEHQASIGNIDMMKIKRLLSENPWIESSSAFISLNDTLFIKAKEHSPVLRVYNNEGHSIYVTEDGNIIPSSPVFTPRLIIANGDFQFPVSKDNANLNDTLYAQSGLSEALAIALALRNDRFLNSNVGQIYKNKNNEYELMVNNLSARVIIGDTIAVSTKLSRLGTLLEKYSGTDALKDYKTLDLRYKNQIVCTKK